MYRHPDESCFRFLFLLFFHFIPLLPSFPVQLHAAPVVLVFREIQVFPGCYRRSIYGSCGGSESCFLCAQWNPPITQILCGKQLCTAELWMAVQKYGILVVKDLWRSGSQQRCVERDVDLNKVRRTLAELRVESPIVLRLCASLRWNKQTHAHC